LAKPRAIRPDAASNARDHKVTFEMARDACNEPLAVSWEDERFDYDEDRYILLGMVDDQLICVGYTYRGRRVRIITARGADRHERRLYHETPRG
jgi:uncharacterized protein